MHCTVLSPFVIMKTRLAATDFPPHSFVVLSCIFPFYRCEIQSTNCRFSVVFLFCSQNPRQEHYQSKLQKFLSLRRNQFSPSATQLQHFSRMDCRLPNGRIVFRCDADNLTTVRVFRTGHFQQNAPYLLEATYLTYGL
jgi:hypothetical protein